MKTNIRLQLCLRNIDFFPLYLACILTSNIQILVNHSKCIGKQIHTKKLKIKFWSKTPRRVFLYFWLLKPDLYRRFPLECELMRLMHLFLAWTSHYTPEFCTHWCMHHPWICNSSPNSKKDNVFVLHFLMILVHHLKYTHCNFQIFCCFFKKNFLVNHRIRLWLHLRHEFGSSRFYK